MVLNLATDPLSITPFVGSVVETFVLDLDEPSAQFPDGPPPRLAKRVVATLAKQIRTYCTDSRLLVKNGFGSYEGWETDGNEFRRQGCIIPSTGRFNDVGDLVHWVAQEDLHYMTRVRTHDLQVEDVIANLPEFHTLHRPITVIMVRPT